MSAENTPLGGSGPAPVEPGSKSFPKTARLRSPAEFEAAMVGERRQAGGFSVRALWNGRSARLGLIVGARFEPLSPRRNAIKRAAREAFREMAASLPPVDIALRLAKKGPANESMADFKTRVTREIRQLLALCLDLKPPAPGAQAPAVAKQKTKPGRGAKKPGEGGPAPAVKSAVAQVEPSARTSQKRRSGP